MSKTELISTVAERTAISKKDVDSAMSAMIDVIIGTVTKEEKVQLVDFDTFEVRSCNGRQGRDPRANSPITIPASKIPASKAGKAFKDATDR